MVLMNQDSVRAKINTLERQVPQAMRGAVDILRHELNERFSVFLERLESVLEHFSADAHCSISQVQLFAAQADFFLNQQGFRLALDEQLLASFAVGNTHQEISSLMPQKFSWLVSPFTPYEDSALVDSLGQWAAMHGSVSCNPFSPAALQQQMAAALGAVLSEPRTALLIMEEYRQWLSREMPFVLLAVREGLQVQGVELHLSNVTLKDADNKEMLQSIDVHLAQLQDYMGKHTLYESPERLLAQIISVLSVSENNLSAVIGRVQQVFAQKRSHFWLHDCQRNAFFLLQIPAIKFAIDGHDFSHRDTHLFRYLLALIGEIGHGRATAMLDNSESDVYQALHKAILLVMSSRAADPAGLVMAVDELLRLSSDSRISTLSEVDKHSLTMLYAIGSGREMIRKARTIVAGADSASTKISEDVLLGDLVHAWSDVMLKLLLDHGEKSEELAAALATLNHLLTAIADVHSGGSQQQAIQDIPDLIRSLRSGLEKQYSSLETSRILAGLETLHMQLLREDQSIAPRKSTSTVSLVMTSANAALSGEPGEWFHTGDSPKGVWQLLGNSADGTILARGIDGALVAFPPTVIIDFLPRQDNIYRAVH